ncbi:MAG: hypothetical protein HN348_21025 [Proteobacteria bacterium]|nr:hypothetical protein [Pseudomonadota bacterium]
MSRSKEAEAIAQRLAHRQGRRDEVLNVELGQALARKKDRQAVTALTELFDDKKDGSGAIKVLYECGYIEPELLVPHTDVFVGLLRCKNNRWVWGAATALACVAQANPDAVWNNRQELFSAFAVGSVITKDASLLALCRVAAADVDRARELGPWFVQVFGECRAKDLASWATKVVPHLPPLAQDEVVDILRARLPEVTAASAKKKIDRLIK